MSGSFNQWARLVGPPGHRLQQFRGTLVMVEPGPPFELPMLRVSDQTECELRVYPMDNVPWHLERYPDLIAAFCEGPNGLSMPKIVAGVDLPAFQTDQVELLSPDRCRELDRQFFGPVPSGQN